MVGSHGLSWLALDSSWIEVPGGPEGSWGRLESVRSREPFGYVSVSNTAAQ